MSVLDCRNSCRLSGGTPYLGRRGFLSPKAVYISCGRSFDFDVVSGMSSTSKPSVPKASLPSAEEVKDELVEASKQTVSSFRSLAAGGVGGVCAVLVGHPFDLVKVRMQTAEKGVYTGAIDVVKKTVAREGLRKVGNGVFRQGAKNLR